MLLSLLACQPSLLCGAGTVQQGDTCVVESVSEPFIDTLIDDTEDTAAPPPAPLLADDFDTLDEGVWSFGDWVLGGTQLDPAQLSTPEGVLTITVEPDGDAWRGGEIYSTEAFGHAEWTARIAAPAEAGTVCAFFLYAAVVLEDTWVTNEIDVELVSGQVFFSTYSQWRIDDGWSPGPTHDHVAWTLPDGFDTSQWHDYTVRYAADGVAFLVDGQEAAFLDGAVPLGTMHARFNHWTGGGWDAIGTPEDARLSCQVDTIKGEAL